MRIETIYYADRGQNRGDKDDRVDHQGRQIATKRFTQIITPYEIVEQFHGEMPIIRPNLLGEVPVVHIRNQSIPKEYYGLPDGFDLMDPQRELNEKLTDVSDTVNYHSAPITVIYGAKAKNLERGPKQIWAGLPADARVENLKLEGDLTAAMNYVGFIKKSIHELSDIPEGSLGATQPVSNTSGVALHIQYQPLIEKTDRKKANYEPGFEQINYFILRIGQVKGLISLPFDVCKQCGGRIVEIDSGAVTQVWSPEVEAFVATPVRKKRCYHVDRQTMEFTDPDEMRVKFWREYGFGHEIREMPYGKILGEIAAQGRSFWDYTQHQEEQLAAWSAANVPPPPIVPIATHQDDPGGAIGGSDGSEVPPGVVPPPPPPPDGVGPGGQIPGVHAGKAHPPVPHALRIMKLPDADIDLPEEPETVQVVRTWANPNTGEVAYQETIPMFLVPTGCRLPRYLNPFENTVAFNDVLPKDKALEAQLFQQYLAMEIVDTHWVQEKIPEVAADKAGIRKRMKATSKAAEGLSPQQVVKTAAGDQITYGPEMPAGNELAPTPTPQATVPGVGGNPASMANSE